MPMSRLLGETSRDVLAVDDDLALLSGRSNPATSRSAVVLPQPDGPSSERNSPSPSLDLDAVERLDRTEVAVEILQFPDRPLVSSSGAAEARGPRLRPTSSRTPWPVHVMLKAHERQRSSRETPWVSFVKLQ